MNQHEFDNDVVCRVTYAWAKGDGYEPYSPFVASLTCMVLDLIEADRARLGVGNLATHLERLKEKWLRNKRGIDLHVPNMDATAKAFGAIACLFGEHDGYAIVPSKPTSVVVRTVRRT